MNEIFDKILALLEREHIAYILQEHEPVRTSEEAAKVRGVEIAAGVKSMVVKCDNSFYLFMLPGSARINWKRVKTITGCKNVRFATEEEAEELTHVKMGSVPPFPALLNLKGYIDYAVFRNEMAHFNPGSVIHTISMKAKDLGKINQAIQESFMQ